MIHKRTVVLWMLDHSHETIIEQSNSPSPWNKKTFLCHYLQEIILHGNSVSFSKFHLYLAVACRME